MHKKLIALFVLCLALVLSLVAAEVVLRIASKYWLSVYDVEMWRYAKLIKVISPRPGVVEEQRPNGDAFLMGARVRTEENGFRLPEPATQNARRPDDRVVVAVGDSLTFGWGVPEGMTFSDQLERLLNDRCPKEGGKRVTVHNAGIGNCNTSMEYQRYKQAIRPKIKPEWVVLGYSYNDAEPDPVPDTNPLFWNSSLASLVWARTTRFRTPVLRDYKTYYQGLYVEGQPGWAHNKQALKEFGELLTADGIPHTLLLMPELHEPKNFGPLAGIYVPVRQVAESTGFEVIDGSTEFPAGSGERYWVSREDAHPNGEAQTFYAKALATSKYACGTSAPAPAAAAAPVQ